MTPSIARSRLARRSRSVAATRLARRVGSASEDQLERIHGVRARMIVGTIFRLIPLQLDRRRAQGVDAAIEWRIGEPDGRALLYTLTIRDGRGRASRRPVAEPDLALEMSTADFLRLVAGVENGLTLFSKARLRIARGDLELAMRLPTIFRIPRELRSR